MMIFRRRWPRPRHAAGDEPHMVFMATLPYSGSTAVISFLDTSHRSMLLQERGEGQWLIPGLCDRDRWTSSKRVDHRSVKAVWLRAFQDRRRRDPSIDFVIEKSPPNIVRFEDLRSDFERTSAFACSREPLASCASLLRNHHPHAELEGVERERVLASIVDKWIERSMVLRDLIERLSLPVLSYEHFCADPLGSVSKLGLPEDLVESIDDGAAISVKGASPMPIVDRNREARSVLGAPDLDLLIERLRAHGGLLDFFGHGEEIRR